MKQLLTPKEKFLKSIEDNFLVLTNEELVDAILKISIEEKIELLNDLFQDGCGNDYENQSTDDLFESYQRLKTELQNELKQL